MLSMEGLASPRSLVLIDELGRGTAPAEGVGISHVIAEELIRLKVCGDSYCNIRRPDLVCSVFCLLCDVSSYLLVACRRFSAISSHFTELTTTLAHLPGVVKYICAFHSYTLPDVIPTVSTFLSLSAPSVAEMLIPH